jgi:hypothetical protein
MPVEGETMTQNAGSNTGNVQVKINTGKDWGEWTALLDEWGGENKSVMGIKHRLIQQHRLSPFWAQMIAVDYKWTQWRVGGGFHSAFVPDKITEKSNTFAQK